MKWKIVIFVSLLLVFLLALGVKLSGSVSAEEPLLASAYPECLTAEQAASLQGSEGYQSYDHYMVWALSATGGMEYRYIAYDACSDSVLFTVSPNKPFGSGRLLVMSSSDGFTWTVTDNLTNGSGYYFRGIYTVANSQSFAGSLLYSDCDLYWGDADTPFFTACPMPMEIDPSTPPAPPSGEGDVLSALPCLLGIIFGGLCFSSLRWWR